MEGTKAALSDMLLCRERRVQIQENFRKKHHAPVISFSMNIPGPIKTTPEIRNAFEAGKQEILNFLYAEHIPIIDSIEIHEITGDEMILSVGHPAKKLKERAVFIEETNIFGRLFDIDIIDKDGTKLSRNSPRRCILCGRPAHECSRTRLHSVEEMQNRIAEMVAIPK